MNDFRTVYTKDYVKHPDVRSDKCGPPLKKNPIMEPFSEYLQVDLPKEDYPDPSDEYWKQFLERKFIKEYPHLKERYFKEDIDTDLIKKHRYYDQLTVYQRDLCKLDKVSKEEKKYEFQIDPYLLPETTQRRSYRNPVIIDKMAFKPVGKIMPESTLGATNKFAEAGKMEADESTYMATIGKLGEEIIVDQMLGKINHFC